MDRPFLFGAGYSARAYARMAPASAEIAGTTRSEAKHALLRRAGIVPLRFDGRTLSEELTDRLGTATALVISIAPVAGRDPVIEAAGAFIAAAMPRLQWIGYLSTLGVYGDHGGAWVDEDTPPSPLSERSRWRAAAETEWQQLGARMGVPVALFRIAGIYGPGRNAILRLKEGTAKRLVKPGQVFNRIHVEDVARAIAFVGERRLAGPFNLADGSPSPAEDVVACAAALTGMTPPPETPYDPAGLTPMARSFYNENKRVRPGRLLDAGFSFLYPDYREALASLWRQQNWQSE